VSPSGLSAPLHVVMNGDRLDIQASVDLAGLKKLKEMLTKFEGILEMMEPDKKEAATEAASVAKLYRD
jgi:hypothetical protein